MKTGVKTGVTTGGKKSRIVRLMHHFTHKNHLCLCFELLSINLYELLKQNQFRGLPLDLTRRFTGQILQGLQILSDVGIIHCDLKPENILLRNLRQPQCSLIDFGSACYEGQTVYTYIQSRFYRSPEVRKQPIITSKQPIIVSKQPIITSKQPINISKQPIITSKQPITIVYRSSSAALMTAPLICGAWVVSPLSFSSASPFIRGPRSTLKTLKRRKSLMVY